MASTAYAGSDAPAAQALFNEAKKLMAEGRWAEACPKLEESQKLDPGIGTQFNLANCYERTGRTASAWAVFLNVAGEAKAAGQSAREKVARDRAVALEPKLSKLIISVRASDVPVKITRDTLEVGRGQWGTPIPIDAGEHRVVATAPGKKTWEKVVRVAPDGATATVEIPPLQDDPAALAAAAAAASENKDKNEREAAEDPHPGRTQRTIGIVVGAAGLIGIGAGTYFGLTSRSKRDDSSPHCNADNRCDDDGLALRDDALKNGTYSTLAFAMGGAALVGGIILFATAPKARASQAGWHATPMVGQRTMGLHLQGRW
ncbi:hypothetical protein [Pendulispora albinea]|uniref:PEGA domain-containing protein n=1 Tax=Pendulispora albinea TaxID=2741071 RepID=A0ABZ2M544_9BACT